MQHTIQLETRAAQPLAVVRRLVRPAELSRVVPEACGLVWNALRAEGLHGGRHVSVYLEAQNNGQLNVEIGVELDAPFSGHGEVVASATPAGEVVSTIHRGPYPTLAQANAAIRQWCTDHGRTLAGPSWELYGHWQEAWNNDPSLITTEVCFLLR
jgi:effector-binding domain-containing protein